MKSGLGKRIGIVTDSDSCPTLCYLVLTGSSRTEKEMALDTVVSKFLQCWTTFAATKHLLSPPPTPFPILGSRLGGHNNTLDPCGPETVSVWPKMGSFGPRMCPAG